MAGRGLSLGLAPIERVAPAAALVRFRPVWSAYPVDVRDERVTHLLKHGVNILQLLPQRRDVVPATGKLVRVDVLTAFGVDRRYDLETGRLRFRQAGKRLHQVVNWETAKAVAAQGFAYINREEDMGDVGLREAKISYHPIEIIKSLELIFSKHSHAILS